MRLLIFIQVRQYCVGNYSAGVIRIRGNSQEDAKRHMSNCFESMIDVWNGTVASAVSFQYRSNELKLATISGLVLLITTPNRCL